MEVVQMLLEATTIHKDIIEVYYYKLIEQIEENLVYQLLEGWRAISEPKRHHYLFEKIISDQNALQYWCSAVTLT